MSMRTRLLLVAATIALAVIVGAVWHTQRGSEARSLARPEQQAPEPAAAAPALPAPVAPADAPAAAPHTRRGPELVLASERASRERNVVLGILVVAALAGGGVYLLKRRGLHLPALPGGDPIDELREVAARIHAWTLDDDPKILDRLNRRAKQIGERIYREGGLAALHRAHRLAGSSRAIESAWDGIGPWRG